MIKSKSDMILLCEKQLNELTNHECRILIFNYIYHLTGKEVPEVFSAIINRDPSFASKMHKIYRYYKNL